jgi:hypothetical protein
MIAWNANRKGAANEADRDRRARGSGGGKIRIVRRVR